MKGSAEELFCLHQFNQFYYIHVWRSSNDAVQTFGTAAVFSSAIFRNAYNVLANRQHCVSWVSRCNSFVVAIMVNQWNKRTIPKALRRYRGWPRNTSVVRRSSQLSEFVANIDLENKNYYIFLCTSTNSKQPEYRHFWVSFVNQVNSLRFFRSQRAGA